MIITTVQGHQTRNATPYARTHGTVLINTFQDTCVYKETYGRSNETRANDGGENPVPYGTVPYGTVPYRTVLYRTVPYQGVRVKYGSGK